MILAIDCDNVLCGLQTTITNEFNERYGTTYTLKDFKKYNLSECLNKTDAINMKTIYGEHGIYDKVEPLPNAKNAIQRLKRAGHEIYIITDTIPAIFEEKVNWIRYNFDIDEGHIISMRDKWLFKCDIMVEDNLDNLLGGYHYDRILFNYPWNQDVRDEVYDIHRVQNWSEAIDIINKLNEKWSDVTV